MGSQPQFNFSSFLQSVASELSSPRDVRAPLTLGGGSSASDASASPPGRDLDHPDFGDAGGMAPDGDTRPAGEGGRGPGGVGRALPDGAALELVDGENAEGALPQLPEKTITVLKVDVLRNGAAEECLRRIAVNRRFICYGLALGHIRVLFKSTGAKALLKGHTAQLTDLQFLNYEEDWLLTAGADHKIFIFRLIYTQLGGMESQSLLQLDLSSTVDPSPEVPVRVLWHPMCEKFFLFSANDRIFLFSIERAVKGESVSNAAGRLSSVVHSGEVEPVVCTIGADFRDCHYCKILATSTHCTWLSGQKEGSLVAAATAQGNVLVWRLPEGDILPLLDFQRSVSWALGPDFCPYGGQKVRFVDWCSPNCLLTAGGSSACEALKLWGYDWSKPMLRSPDELRRLDVQLPPGKEGQLFVAVESRWDLVLVANSASPVISVLQLDLRSEGAAFSSVAQFALKQPILSMQVVCNSEAAGGVDELVRLYVVQTEAVNQYSLNPYLCCPPAGDRGQAEEGGSQDGVAAGSCSNLLDDHLMKLGYEGVGMEDSFKQSREQASPGLYSATPAAPQNGSEQGSALDSSADLLCSTTDPQGRGSRHLGGGPDRIPSEDALQQVSAALPTLFGGAFGNGQPSSCQDHISAGPLPVIIPEESSHGHVVESGRAPGSSSAGSAPKLPLQNQAGASGGTLGPRGASWPEPSNRDGADSQQGIASPSVSGTALEPPTVVNPRVTQAAMGMLQGVTPIGGGPQPQKSQSAVDVPSDPPSSAGLPDMVGHGTVYGHEEKRSLPSDSRSHYFEGSPTVEKVILEHRKIMKNMEHKLGKTVRDVEARVVELSSTLKSHMEAHREGVAGNQLQALVASATQEVVMSTEKVIRNEMKSALRTAQFPGSQKALMEGISKNLTTALSRSMEMCIASQLPKALMQPLQEYFKDSFRTLIPAFEAAVQAMFTQIHGSLVAGLSEHLGPAGGAMNKVSASVEQGLSQVSTLVEGIGREMQDMRQQFVDVKSKMAELKRDIMVLRDRPSSPAVHTRSASRTPSDPSAELAVMIKAGDYEGAFNQALSLARIDVVTWLISQIDPYRVLGGSTCPLSQSVLLSLLQQLGCDLNANTAQKLEWIKAAAMHLDHSPSSPRTSHLQQGVLDHLLQQLNAVAPTLTGPTSMSARIAVHLVGSLQKQTV
ncbi:unnamed protein product [Ostreobium quekettii]|uniref:Enhancer of mRNA-decapping protein 4 C-terminal domain-containing protein n=1 Tax=Ostreobium quekettii TaxID=121088 RepID=A0A8S1J2F4_9CHLO|nr:unnamed protein product [Ostreobium quekettii]|eukprot:evm.model.scf_37.15 EVM.evm.TU.scf_37.15   scf_37:126473-130595(+)